MTSEPVLPRSQKRPRRYDDDSDISDCIEDNYRCIYYEALDLIIQGIKPLRIQALKLKAATKEKYDTELAFVTNFYKDDFNQEQ